MDRIQSDWCPNSAEAGRRCACCERRIVAERRTAELEEELATWVELAKEFVLGADDLAATLKRALVVATGDRRVRT